MMEIENNLESRAEQSRAEQKVGIFHYIRKDANHRQLIKLSVIGVFKL